jgi:hypothetical protein
MNTTVRPYAVEASPMTALIRFRNALALTAYLGAAPAVLAEPPAKPDLLDETQRLQEVAIRKVEADVRLGLSEAASLAQTDRPKAVERLKAVLALLESDALLSDERKATHLRVVKDRIRIAEMEAISDAEDAAARAARDAIQQQQKAASEKQAEIGAKIKSALASIAALRSEGKLSDAAKQTKTLLKDHPDDLAVQVLNNISSTGFQLQEAKVVRTETEEKRLVAMRDMDRSMIPPIGDIEFPKDWKEKSARRLKSQQLSPTEMRILQALSTPISVEFKGSKLQDVVDYISTMTNIPIMIDKGALDENQLSYDSPISFALKNKIETRTALRSILNQVGLTYVVRDGVIQVTTQLRARDMMVTKSYYIGDLVSVAGLFGGSTQYGLAMDQAQLAQNVAGVVEMVTSSLDPMSWAGKGGNGAIGFNIPTMSLIVRQSAEVHMMIRGGLYK